MMKCILIVRDYFMFIGGLPKHRTFRLPSVLRQSSTGRSSALFAAFMAVVMLMVSKTSSTIRPELFQQDAAPIGICSNVETTMSLSIPSSAGTAVAFVLRPWARCVGLQIDSRSNACINWAFADDGMISGGGFCEPTQASQ